MGQVRPLRSPMGSIWIAHRIELPGRAHPLQLAERRGERGALCARHSHHRPLLVVGRPGSGASGPSTSALVGEGEQCQRVVERSGLGTEGRDPASPAGGGPRCVRRPRDRRNRPGPTARAPGARVRSARRRRAPGRPGGAARPRWTTGAAPPRRRACCRGRAAARCRGVRRRRSPPAATGSAPGVATTIRRSSSTSARIRSPLEVTTGTGANARPSSSAVRASPITGARRPRPPHSAHAQYGASVAHQRQRGGVVGPVSASGPLHTAHRAGVRHRSQAKRRT